MIKQDFERPIAVKLLINIGALLDIPTGFYVKGKEGQNVLLGGLGGITAVVGRGNRFKSTVIHYMMLSAADRIMSTAETSMSTYDTEINIHEHTLKRFISRFTELSKSDIIYEGIWNITDKTVYHGNKWFEQVKAYIKNKVDNKKECTVSTPFIERDGVSNMEVIVPTFSEIDSFSEFETEDVAKMQDENELGDSGANTLYMRQGLSKARFLSEAPSLFGGGNHFLLMTAHLDDAVQVSKGPYAPQPVKKLQHMKMDDKVKGVTGKFFFLMNNCWHASTSTGLVNQGTKGPEYPKNANDNIAGDTDLNLVTLVQLRSKSGPSGYSVDLVVSQSEGVLPSLTEFHFIKTNKYGLSGTLQSYSLDIYPDVKLSRTTVRSKIDTDEKLRRALNITAELLQISQYHRSYSDILCTPKELYDDIIKLGYDWNMILSETRGWWTVNDDKHPLKFLSTLDLLEMRAGRYTPYWLNKKDKKK